MSHRLKVLAMLVALGLLASACGGDSDVGASDGSSDDTSAEDGGGEDDVCTEDRAGGSLTVSPLSLGQSLDPYGVGGASSQTALEFVMIYDSLLRFDEESGEFVPQLAESIEPNEDASVWTLKLREGIEFGNGDPFDAAAVVAATERYLDPEGTSRMKGVGTWVEAVEAVDPLTVRYTLTSPWGFFPIHLSAGGGTVGALGVIPNVKLIEERGEDAFGQDATGGGAGPYEVTEWSPPERVVVEAKDDWWGGPVCIEEITLTALTSGQARLDAMRTGEVDMAIQYRDPVVAAEAKDEFDHVVTYHQSGGMLEMNMTHPELGDVRTRRAIAAAVDPEVVNQRAYGGEGLAWSGVVHPDAQLLEGTEGPAFDPDAAEELVQELKDEGMDLSFELLVADQAANVEGALATEAMLEAVGFEIEVRTITTQQIISAVYSDRQFELAMGGQVGSEATLYASLTRFLSTYAANPYGYAEPDMDAALGELQAAQGSDELQAAIEQVQEVWNDTIPAVVYMTDEGAWLWSGDVRGMQFTRGVTPYFDTAYIAG